MSENEEKIVIKREIKRKVAKKPNTKSRVQQNQEEYK